MNQRAVLLALLSAALFGASTPAAKLLLGTTNPAILAGLFYCGAGLGVAVLRRAWLPASEAALGRNDLPWLAGAIIAGGIVGPVLLMAGLQRTEASAASLLLTLEGVATALMAWFVFHENFGRRIALGMASIVAGAAVLSWTGQPSSRTSPGRSRSSAHASRGGSTTTSRGKCRLRTPCRSSS
jgi:drug/metabolite transporter (DMT)-like permease